MKKITAIIIILISSFALNAQDFINTDEDPILLSDGTYRYPKGTGAEVFYAAVIGEVDLSQIDIRNKVIYFASDNPHEFDDFTAHFSSLFVREVIATDWFREQDFQTRELHSICRELRNRASNVDRLPPMPFMVTVVANDRYGYLVRWMNDNPLPGRIFFELKPR